MASEAEIRATCAAARGAVDFVEFVAKDRQTGQTRSLSVSHDHPAFDSACQVVFQDASDYFRRLPPQYPMYIFSPQQVVSAARFARSHGFQTVTLYGSEHPLARYLFSSALEDKIKNFGLGARGPQRTTTVGEEQAMDHEWGHLRDMHLIRRDRKVDRRLREIEAGRELGKEDFRAAANRILDLIRTGIPSDQQAFFRNESARVFGSLDAMDEDRLAEVVKVLLEALRYGEEMHDARLPGIAEQEKYFFPNILRGAGSDADKMSVFKTNRDAGYLLMVNAVARLQVIGLWEKFRSTQPVDNHLVTLLDPQDLAFFQLCLRATQRYFPTIRPNE